MFKRDIFFIFFSVIFIDNLKSVNSKPISEINVWTLIIHLLIREKMSKQKFRQKIGKYSKLSSIENAFLFLILYSGLLFFIWFDFEWKKVKKFEW